MEVLAKFFSIIAIVLFAISSITSFYTFGKESRVFYQIVEKTFIGFGICLVLAVIFGVLSCLLGNG
ncbi:MAG: hypothetical protein DRP34_00055 [Thermodesulfobacteriota bacterium]|nr:MAG: hypothetical protein DRP34_00055 [Thermodesulfobacteriota bacterium]